MSQEIYLTVLHCKQCQASTLIKEVEYDCGDWIAACSKCGVQNILEVIVAGYALVIAPPLRVVGVRGI